MFRKWLGKLKRWLGKGMGAYIAASTRVRPEITGLEGSKEYQSWVNGNSERQMELAKMRALYWEMRR